MTPEQKLKHLILIVHARISDTPVADGINAENIDAIYEEADGEDCNLQDAREEVRGGQYETKIPADYSRHYESDSVAAKAPDGSWIGWTYWYGGGKHGEPEAIDWIDSAYAIDCTEEEKLVVVRTFTKQGQ